MDVVETAEATRAKAVPWSSRRRDHPKERRRRNRFKLTGGNGFFCVRSHEETAFLNASVSSGSGNEIPSRPAIAAWVRSRTIPRIESPAMADDCTMLTRR